MKLPIKGMFLCLLLLTALPGFAQFTVTITFDENCHGSLTNSVGFSSALPCSLVNDPGPGGMNGVLFYSLLSPPGLVGGDVYLTEPPNNTTYSDVLRFDPTILNGGVFVYSDNSDGVDSLADIGFPGSAYTNNITLPEVGPEGNNGATYTPTAGQPGFVAGAGGPVTYIFTSDSPVPEPATSLLLLLPLGVFGLRKVRGRAV